MAGKITQAQILADFQLMHQYRVPYQWGTHDWRIVDGKASGSVDCSGAFVWSYDRHGLDIYNGSNRIARVYCGEMIQINASTRGLLVPGMAAFKRYAPGNKNYNLKSSYQHGGKYCNGDLNDYYHIGLIDADTNYILNAQSAKTGFVRSRITENWTSAARLNAVIYQEDGSETMIQMRVTAESGNTVNMRRSASTQSAIVTAVPVGSVVSAGPESTGWRSIEYNNLGGYMMSKYLKDYESPGIITITEQQLQEMQQLAERIQTILTAVGKGVK